MKTCEHCGKENDGAAKFCESCGQKIEAEKMCHWSTLVEFAIKKMQKMLSFVSTVAMD